MQYDILIYTLALQKGLSEYLKENLDSAGNEEEIVGLKESVTSSRKLFRIIKTYSPILSALEKHNLPLSMESLKENHMFLSMVNPVHQNTNLKASLELISNEIAFHNR